MTVPPQAEECDSKRILHITLYKPKLSIRPAKRMKGFHFLFFFAYLYQTYWCLSTVGEPYRKFLEKADREGFEVMEGTTKMRAELQYALLDLNDPDRPTEKIGWFDWMSMDIDEHYERKKREKEKSVLDSLPKRMRVPNKYSPAFTPMLITGILVMLHALVMLLQHWSVGFNVLLNYNPMDMKEVVLPEEGEEDFDVDDPQKDSLLRPLSLSQNSNLPTHARITPSAGKDLLLPLSYLPTLGITFEYHRRRYVWNPSTHIWTKIRCRTDMPTAFFPTWSGFTSPTQIRAATLRFGKNIFDVRQPTFSKLYKAQLLSPFTVFQLFCVVLWMLDDYWQYSAFTLFMILTFEATVVFSRIKSLAALRGMGNKSRKIMVYRMGQWGKVESHDLLPGDVFSLTRHRRHFKPADVEGKEKKKDSTEEEDGDIVPADILLLRGSTVVNEATLTGESVPQMKEGLSEILEGEVLAMKGKHKSHILYSGTKLLQCKGSEEKDQSGSSEEEDTGEKEERVSSTAVNELYNSIPSPPDNGCLCFVLRTGFSSAQGKLVRMIEGSQEKVKGHEKETGLLLLLLFCFAVVSSGYVLRKGMKDDNRSQYELLLHCILIITSVIPPELPMQMALAVNSSLMTLMKMQVFCTEPYRVPMAGKLDVCLFDKTGTLTTDELVAVGVCQTSHLKIRDISNATAAPPDLTPMTKVSNESGLVLAGCHSLVFVDGETVGDPLEAAALAAMRWRISPQGKICPCLATEKKAGGKPVSVAGTSVSNLEIVARHHFSSKLQRMSCVVRDHHQRTFAVAKGSPEVMGNYIANKPEGYDVKSRDLAKRGYRVIALAYKSLKHGEVEDAIATRAKCEEGLNFVGFIAFTCRVRKDTRSIVCKLKEGGMNVAMVTGDALLTAAHVAKEVAICYSPVEDDLGDVKNDELKRLLKSKKERKTKEEKPKSILILEQGGTTGMYWQSFDDESDVADFIADEIPALAEKYDLATTGKNLAAAFEFDEDTKKMLGHFKIFARMTPDAKETVIECLHSINLLCLMCGDGANDVGALKQADVGVALLSGFGDVNVDRGEDSNKKTKTALSETTNETTSMITKQELEILKQLPVRLIKMKIRSLGVEPDEYPDLVEKDDLIKLYRIKASEVAVKQHERKNAMEKAKMTRSETQAQYRADMAEKQRKMALRVQELEAQGVQWAQFKAMKEFYTQEMQEGKKKKAAMAKNRSIEGSAAMMTAQLEDLEMDELPIVKIGDASIAAPFTSKMPSIKSCVDIVRQGRCTLVTSMQMYQIMALNCLISSYSLSVLYLDGVKYGDVQMTAMGILGSISFMSVSRSKPLDKLSPVRPLTSIFHPSLFISLLGQFVVHLITMIWAVKTAKQYLPTGYDTDLEGEFKPGILNSVVFLVSNVQQVTVFVVNLQGRPFMHGLTENRPLLWSLLATFILTFMFASESIPGLNKYFQLVPFPDEAFRDFILKLLVADVVASFSFDRLMKLAFCPKILFASVEGTGVKDVIGMIKTVCVILGIMYFLLGNNEQWEEMLREEGRLEDLMNGTNVTMESNVSEIVTESIVGGAANVVGIESDEL